MERSLSVQPQVEVHILSAQIRRDRAIEMVAGLEVQSFSRNLSPFKNLFGYALVQFLPNAHQEPVILPEGELALLIAAAEGLIPIYDVRAALGHVQATSGPAPLGISEASIVTPVAAVRPPGGSHGKQT